MKYLSLKLKIPNSPFYFKVDGDDFQTEIYFVYRPLGNDPESMKIFCGKALTREEIMGYCLFWRKSLCEEAMGFMCQFDVEEAQIDE